MPVLALRHGFPLLRAQTEARILDGLFGKRGIEPRKVRIQCPPESKYDSGRAVWQLMGPCLPAAG